MKRHDFINWFEDVRVGTRRLISMMPDEAFDFQFHEESLSMLGLMQLFAKLEEQFVRGVCTGDWTDPKHPTDPRSQQVRAFEEDTDDFCVSGDGIETPETVDDILEHLDLIHQESLDILADITDEEFMNRRVEVPWGETGTIERLLVGMVEREIHHRSELYFALREFGVPVSEAIIFGP
ncbi:MAG: DUF664 domain-containing protein [bacterium]|nr:DUF664 domain-containing protein [bacterium]